jgi:hypothetical protein
MKNKNENGQGDSALREEEENISRIKAKIRAFLESEREFPNPSDRHPFYAAE